MSYLSEFLSQIQSHLGLLISAGILGVATFLFSGRWFVTVLAVLGVAVTFLFLWYLPYSWYPPADFLSTQVPWPIYPHFWQSMYLWGIGLGLGAWLLIHLMRRAKRRRLGVRVVDTSKTGEASELETAWSEILRMVREAGLDITRLRTVLVMAPSPGWGTTLLEAGGATLHASAPGTAGPLHADLTTHGLVIDISAITCFGTRNIATLAQLEAFCRMLRAHRPECPTVRSITIVLPADWLEADSAAARAALSARDDLRAIQRIFLARFPIYVLVAGMERVAGFTEYARRIPATSLNGRRGFSDPSRPYSGSLIKSGLAYMSQFFYERVLEAINGGFTDEASNVQLFRFLDAFENLRSTLKTVLDSLLATPDEPVLFHGCYFLGTGTRDVERAFSAGLVRDPEGGIFAERRPARWAEEAWDADGFYHRAAYALGGLTALVAGWFWLRLLRQPGTSLWWALVAAALVIAWMIAIIGVIVWSRKLRAELR